jgi:hypothetical protein
VHAKESALQRLDRNLLETEIYLAELDLDLTKGLAYGWRDDATTKFSEIRANIPTAFAKVRQSLQTFYKELTTAEGAALPEWVYKSFGGALEDVLKALEKRMVEEDGAFQSAVLQVLRNFVKNYRNRIAEAAAKPQQPSPAPATAGEATPASQAARFNDFFEL